ncbi:MAG: hypothetical protein Q9162_003838 [Coniocarpon cinnabarinum]
MAVAVLENRGPSRAARPVGIFYLPNNLESILTEKVHNKALKTNIMHDQAPSSKLEFKRDIVNDGRNNRGISLFKHKLDKVYYIRKKVSPNAVSEGVFDEEVFIASILGDHSRINKLKYWSRNGPGQVATLYYEYCDLGTLKDLFTRATRLGFSRLPQDFLFKASKDIASALCYMHYGRTWEPGRNFPGVARGWQRIAHNDVHEGNIFLSSKSSDPNFPRVVLGDFGNAIIEPSRRDAYESDRRFLGATMAILAGAHFDVDHGMPIFSRSLLTELRGYGVSKLLTDCVKAAYYDRINAWDLTDLIDYHRSKFRQF